MKVDPFHRIDQPPPQRLGAFFRWCLDGSWPMLFIAGAVSALAGTLEVISAWLLGMVVDAVANAASPEGFFDDHLWLVALFAGFYLFSARWCSAPRQPPTRCGCSPT
jgi:ATP-binding cassette, subfamily B, bacterial